MDLNLLIDVIDASQTDLFQKEYFKKQKPVIIKGLIDSTPAGKKWNMDYLKQQLSGTEVMVFDNKNKRNTAYTGGDYKMKFTDFADEIMKDEVCTKRLFLFNAFKHAEELKRDFPCPAIFKSVLDTVGFMFFGGKDTHVRIHFDIDMSNVLHTQFVGSKRVFLFSSEYNDFLYKTPFNTYSIADFQDPDYQKFPALKYAKGYDITLNHGDSLFMPGGYWHYMMYQEGGFAVAYRKLAHGAKNIAQGLLYLTIKLWVDKFLGMLLGKSWIEYKSDIAFRRANKAIQKIELSKNSNP